jgi:hypothetical protein
MTEDNRRQSVGCRKTLRGLNLLALNPRPRQNTAHWLKGGVGEKLNLSLHAPAATKHKGPIASQKGMSSLILFQRAPDRPMLTHE